MLNQRSNRPVRQRRAAALMMVMFIIFMVSSMVFNVLSTEVSQLAVARNVADYERALYLASAGVQHACAELVADSSWRGAVADAGYPADDTYQATATDDTDGHVLVTATGVSGNATRTVEATIQF